MTKQTRRDFIYALFITFMVLVNTLGTKITTLLGVRISVGIFFMPFLFLATDIVGEVYGEKEVQSFINISVIMLILVVSMTCLCIYVRPNSDWPYQQQYANVFSSSLRMTFASLISFLISQKLDVRIFSLLKKITKGKHLWLRNNVATITCNFIDTLVFDFIAFYNITPVYTVSFIFSIILPYWFFKVVFALLDTPFCYLGVKWLRTGHIISKKIQNS